MNNINLEEFSLVTFPEYLLITGEWHKLRNHKYVVRPDYIQWINNKTGNVDAIRRTNEVTKVKENYIRKGLKER